MMHISNDFYVRCNKCNYVSLVKADSVECDTYSYERQMGEEIEYNFHSEICCEKCSSWISFCIRGYEYPVGAFNDSDAKCSGGEFIDPPVVELENSL